MSYAIGKRINEIRVSKKIKQEELASVLEISRQRLARIENGQSDISYRMIKSAAEYLAVPLTEITSAEDEVDLQVLFRDVDNSAEIRESVDVILEIIKTFRAHEKLYFRMKEELDEI